MKKVINFIDMSKMLKYLVFLIISSTAFNAGAQILSDPNPALYGVRYNRGAFDITLMLPTRCGAPTSATHLNIDARYQNRAAIVFDSCGHKTYIWDPSAKSWSIIGNGTNAGNSDSLNHQLAAYYLDRANHTGTQSKASISGLQVALDSNLKKSSNLSDLVSASSARTNLGLGNVDNTSDANKPVSTAQAAAVALKADKTTTVNGHALSSNVVVSASDITTGTLPDAQLSSNIVTLTGTQTLTNKTISQSQVTSLVSDLSAREVLTNKATDFSTVNNTLYPSVAAVKAYADALVVGLLNDRGNYNASGNVYPSSGGSGSAGAILKGDIWFVSVAGTLGGTAVGVGDQLRALVNTPGQTSSNWAISQASIGYVPENTANKSTNTSLGTSNTLFPSQNAVKAYVDAAVANGNTAFGWGNHASAGYSTASNTQTFTNKTWNGIAIGDSYISSASTWNAKQTALSGTGFVKILGSTISYDNSTYLTTSSAASTYLPLTAGSSKALTSDIYLNHTGGVGVVFQGNTTDAYIYNVGSTLRFADNNTVTKGFYVDLTSGALNQLGTGAFTWNGSISGGSFTGPGTGLTGTAASLNIGGNSATTTLAANSTLWANNPYSPTDAAISSYMLGWNGSAWFAATAARTKTFLGYYGSGDNVSFGTGAFTGTTILSKTGASALIVGAGSNPGSYNAYFAGTVGISGAVTMGNNLDVAGSVNVSGNIYAATAASNSITIGVTNSQYGYVGVGGYVGFRQGTDNSFNIDVYNSGTQLNALKINQAGSLYGRGITSSTGAISSEGGSSNTVGAGTYFQWFNNSAARGWLTQLNASHNLDNWYYNGSVWAVKQTFGNDGSITTNSYIGANGYKFPTTGADGGVFGSGGLIYVSDWVTATKGFTVNLTTGGLNQLGTGDLLWNGAINANGGIVKVSAWDALKYTTGTDLKIGGYNSSQWTALNLYTSASLALAINSSQQIRLPAYGAGVLVSDASGNITSSASASVSDGSYTPSFTPISNMGAATPIVVQHFRVGNRVHVAGLITLNASGSGGAYGSISLPVASSLSNGATDGGGSGTATPGGGVYYPVFIDISSAVMVMRFNAGSGAGNYTVSFSFDYYVN
ncbi:MAG: hypothetical protein V4450_07480 [Bacteroidota bacterium]